MQRASIEHRMLDCDARSPITGQQSARPRSVQPVVTRWFEVAQGGHFFTPYAQFTYATRMVLVRTRGEPLDAVSGIAEAVRRADPDLALFDVQTMESRAGRLWATHGFQSALFLIVGAIALFLAAAGVYAVAAHMVASRTREIGTRMALGASARQIAATATVHTRRLAVAGVGTGIVGCLMVSRAMRAMLYETSPFDRRSCWERRRCCAGH